jgi:periplasmic protein CpxP/Spy
MFELGYGLLLARRALLTASILIASCCALYAQTDTQATPPANGPAAGEMYHHRHGVERQLNQLSRVLSLTDEQKTQVKSILQAQHQQMEQLRNSNVQSGQANEAQPSHEQIQAIRQDTKSKIEALLNDDQKVKFEAWVQQRKERMQQRRQPQGQQAPAPSAPGV